ncbi:IclR family transcriptional regulator [Rhodococcus sp. 06-156-3C]|uniref:IclR family transcriptional regulator n=1 Tax=Nocardiaceae TaxID=85025 RepID=UPI00068F589F|nr:MULTISPECIES: helix-turn-helix domain-containing protein [Rhodococcus]OZD13105.1 IclR family transcriptional regulator [Rhodococcus sp. 06-156-4a]OZD17974.1 IclR family transcriptional regulator [Rhodococcus sp. 06-156-3C]OZD20698.1 IclR family transcriptional regulator [Rhodococcus sp. 06-156-4C]OZD30583.1 IclR family transcriptional regulator [Rhodococcus sp. 06-156-3b]OZD32644.1 IclR family transcriptional regulator [Rhodococcus sp. 06-156-3]
MVTVTEDSSERIDREPQNHRTIDRVTRILEEVVYNPGMTFAELSRSIDAPKSSLYGFIRGLIAAGWLHQDSNRFYIGPALHGLTLASGHLRAGSVTDADLQALHEAAEVTVFLGVQAGDDLIYVSEVGADLLAGFAARSNIRRRLLETAGGKALLADLAPEQRDVFLRRRGRDEGHLVDEFLSQYDEIKLTGIAYNTLHNGTRTALATVVPGPNGKAAAEVTLVGPTTQVEPRLQELSALLLEHVGRWKNRSPGKR